MPFLTIGTQGQESKASSVADFVVEKKKGKSNEDGKRLESLVVQDTHASVKEE